MGNPRTPWPHAPTHELGGAGTYFVTASAYQKQHRFAGEQRLAVLQRGLLTVAQQWNWQLEAWAVFSNHYHFVGHSPTDAESAESLREMVKQLHVEMSSWINRLDGTPGRKNWHNYRDTRLTYQPSYMARLNYVHNNAVKHGLVSVANHYPWCSAGWFERSASLAQVKSIYRFKTDKLEIDDDFDPDPEW
jgi:putative transposase